MKYLKPSISKIEFSFISKYGKMATPISKTGNTHNLIEREIDNAIEKEKFNIMKSLNSPFYNRPERGRE